MEKYNIQPKNDLVFDLRVQEACKACKRYSLTGCCPPHIGTFEYYQKLVPLYDKGTIYIKEYEITELTKWRELGRSSSLDLHQLLIEEREELLRKGHYFNLLLGGGSCKWCLKCSIPCTSPQYRAIPIEATGINVVATLAKLKVRLTFPVTDKIYRVGLLLWSTYE